MKKYYYLIGIIVVLAVIAVGFKYFGNPGHGAGTHEARVTLGNIDEHIAARGRVEGISEEIKVTSKLAGRLEDVRVEEGNHLKKGAVIAVLENNDLLAAVHAAEAQQEQARANLEKVMNGARQQEREEARATMEQARAEEQNARSLYDRWSALYQQGGFVSKERVEQLRDSWKAAKSKLDAASEHFQLINAPPRPEDAAMAKAQLASAAAQVELTRVNYENSFIRAPISGVVLKKYLKPGESIIAFDRSSAPVVSMTDDSVLQVRAEIDESDVNKIQLGQRASITADAYGTRKLWGTVTRIGNSIGKKNVRTDDPTEKVDTEILETMIRVDGGGQIQVGLRVDVHIQIARMENVLVLPRPAVKTDSKGDCFVTLKTKGSAFPRPVKIGACDGLNCEVVSGLKDGDTVVY
jgi:HlyD family secretion protein